MFRAFILTEVTFALFLIIYCFYGLLGQKQQVMDAESFCESSNVLILMWKGQIKRKEYDQSGINHLKPYKYHLKLYLNNEKPPKPPKLI